MSKGAARVLKDAVLGLRDIRDTPQARLAAGLSGKVHAALAEHPLRDLVTSSAGVPAAGSTARSPSPGPGTSCSPAPQGAQYDPAAGKWQSGTLRTAALDLPRIAGMGFDVVYLTPVHPIGETHRKGPNNSLFADLGDPGSPYAIGSPAGGHDAIEPTLGTFDDFDAFVASAKDLGMEVALDIALQCSPDHPWVTAHPEWFTTRADGTIAYAENPPKKYQDIYPLNFDNDPEGIYTEIRRVLQVWIDHGVTLFRVDNPHTKPLDFWARILESVRADHPEVIFLSEAFTRPAMMQTLAKIGFHQSYTYFTWRNTKDEIDRVPRGGLGRAGRMDAAQLLADDPRHPAAVPAATGVRGIRGPGRAGCARLRPTWGIYSGYELVEDVPRPGVDEQIDNEKYEFKPRDWAKADAIGINLLLGRLNELRHTHPALQQLRNLRVLPTSDDALVAFAKHLDAEHSPDRARRHHRRRRQPRPVERARRHRHAPPAVVRAGPRPPGSSRTTCCPTRRTSGGSRCTSASTRWSVPPTSSTWSAAVTEAPPTGRHAREPAPTTAQIVLPGHRKPSVPHPVESPGGLTDDREWYRTAVFYEVMLRTFADSSGQGSGDLRGLIDRLDYLQWLGIDCLWLPPFYPSPAARRRVRRRRLHGDRRAVRHHRGLHRAGRAGRTRGASASSSTWS